MGAKSTITITRTEAIQHVIQQLHYHSNETLAKVVEDMNDEWLDTDNYDRSLGLHNFHVVDCYDQAVS